MLPLLEPFEPVDDSGILSLSSAAHDDRELDLATMFLDEAEHDPQVAEGMVYEEYPRLVRYWREVSHPVSTFLHDDLASR